MFLKNIPTKIMKFYFSLSRKNREHIRLRGINLINYTKNNIISRLFWHGENYHISMFELFNYFIFYNCSVESIKHILWLLLCPCVCAWWSYHLFVFITLFFRVSLLGNHISINFWTKFCFCKKKHSEQISTWFFRFVSRTYTHQ